VYFFLKKSLYIFIYLKITTITIKKNSQEFRLCFYLFGLLSAIPVGIFLICVISATCIITVLLSFVWTLAVCTTVTIGLVLLVPVLIAFALVSVLSLVGYSAYTYFVKQTGAKTKTN
jgi:hypothetical protein